MEVGEELARRGHQVTVISPHKYKKVMIMLIMILIMILMMMMIMKVPPGVRDVVFESRFEAVTTQVSEEMMASPDTPFPFGKVTVSRRLSGYSHYTLSRVRWWT